ncbi:MAG: YetF domain-containing protein [Faecousia sp.]
MKILGVILTTLLSVIVLFLLAKIMGHKQIAQMDLFDYIAGITIGSIGAELATELEQPWKPLIAMVIYGGVTFGFSVITSKYPRLRKYINGTPTVILHNGKLYRKNMKKAKLDLSEFMVMCREAGYFNLSDIQTAVFEYNGKLAILPVSDKRPMIPADNNLMPKQETISAEIIMDGRVMDENLQRMGLDEKWLQKQIEAQGFHSAKEIFLGLCDTDRKVTLFQGE